MNIKQVLRSILLENLNKDIKNNLIKRLTEISIPQELKELAKWLRKEIKAGRIKDVRDFLYNVYFENIAKDIASGIIRREDIPNIVSQPHYYRGLFERDGKTFMSKGAAELWSVYQSQIEEYGLSEEEALKVVYELFDINSMTKDELINFYNQVVKEE